MSRIETTLSGGPAATVGRSHAENRMAWSADGPGGRLPGPNACVCRREATHGRRRLRSAAGPLSAHPRAKRVSQTTCQRQRN